MKRLRCVPFTRAPTAKRSGPRFAANEASLLAWHAAHPSSLTSTAPALFSAPHAPTPEIGGTAASTAAARPQKCAASAENGENAELHGCSITKAGRESSPLEISPYSCGNPQRLQSRKAAVQSGARVWVE